jgi:hypothetical protein
MENGEIFAYDERVKLEDMIEPLKMCDGLAGKPKLIFVQAGETACLLFTTLSLRMH